MAPSVLLFYLPHAPNQLLSISTLSLTVFSMRLTFYNLTNHAIAISHPPSSGFCGRLQLNDDTAEEICSVGPMKNQDAEWGAKWNSYVLLRSPGAHSKQNDDNIGFHGISKERLVKPEGVAVRISQSFGASWKVLDIPCDCPWRIYCNQVCSPCRYEYRAKFNHCCNR